jgi:FKBP-type peptidyl-prolyl cis-trans isomerase FkpA
LKPKSAELPELPNGAGEMDPDAPQELTPTSSGLYYRILRKGDGKKPTLANTVVAHYKGWLDNGKEFDASYGKGAPATFPLSRVVPGWQEGLPLVGEGGMIELEIPSDLGYGSRGSPPVIPPGATLHFIVELKQVK